MMDLVRDDQLLETENLETPAGSKRGQEWRDKEGESDIGKWFIYVYGSVSPNVTRPGGEYP
jgi:hypothetical protein